MTDSTISKYRHPISGEPIGFGKFLSWKIQFLIRRWSFLGGITIVTLTCVIWGLNDVGVTTWWNVWASYMALFIESVVGIAVFEQMQADGKAIREILELEKQEISHLKTLLEKRNDVA